MDVTGFDLQFDVSGPSASGTFTALCRELPMIIAATSEAELRQLIVAAVDELTARLQTLGPGGDRAFLKEAGIKVRRMKSEAGRTMTLPVSIHAAAG